MRIVILLVAALLLSPARAEARTWNAAELEALVAPVALQPDPVLFSILDAALVPHEVFDAARAGGAAGHWSQPVQSLRAYPDLLASLAENKQWLFDLGNAWLGQRNDVLAAVHVQRQRAAGPAYAPPPAYVVHHAPVILHHHHGHRHARREHRPRHQPNGAPSPAVQMQKRQALEFEKYHRIPESQRQPIVQPNHGRPPFRRPHN